MDRRFAHYLPGLECRSLAQGEHSTTGTIAQRQGNVPYDTTRMRGALVCNHISTTSFDFTADKSRLSIPRSVLVCLSIVDRRICPGREHGYSCFSNDQVADSSSAKPNTATTSTS